MNRYMLSSVLSLTLSLVSFPHSLQSHRDKALCPKLYAAKGQLSANNGCLSALQKLTWHLFHAVLCN